MTTAATGLDGSIAVDRPAWAKQGLNERDGRYPLGVEAPVLGMVATLMPGVSTLTEYARYYSLYWALADYAERRDLDGVACQQTLRRAEVLLALVTRLTHDLGVHGAGAVQRGKNGRTAWELAETGTTSYSPRVWGFWSQYGGPSDVLGTAMMTDGAIRPGRHACPPEVRDLFAPLFAAASRSDPPSTDALTGLEPLSLGASMGPDLLALRDLFTATRGGRHVADDWDGTDRTRRASLRILLRAGQLAPEMTWSEALVHGVAFGPASAEDVVLGQEDRALAWRGVLLRHYSVGAWRRLWAGLVDFVCDHGVTTRADLHDWMSAQLPDLRVRDWTAQLPAVTDADGHPAPAEEQLIGQGEGVHRDLALLAIGARRRESLDGLALQGFRGGRSAHNSFLGPEWVGRRLSDNRARSVRGLGRDLVDDMLAQSRRVALRKVSFVDGRMQVFSRLHERNDTFTARSREGSGNVGLRVEQLAGLVTQLGLANEMATPAGCALLGLPA